MGVYLFMKTTKERMSTMLKVESLVDEWNNYVKSFGNECAYTDSIVEHIQELVKEL